MVLCRLRHKAPKACKVDKKRSAAIRQSLRLSEQTGGRNPVHTWWMDHPNLLDISTPHYLKTRNCLSDCMGIPLFSLCPLLVFNLYFINVPPLLLQRKRRGSRRVRNPDPGRLLLCFMDQGACALAPTKTILCCVRERSQSKAPVRTHSP